MTDAPQNTPPADNTPPTDNAKNNPPNPDNGKPPAEPAANAGLYKPEGIAEHLVGKDDRETIDKLLNAYTGFRTAAAKKGVPETADGYTLELPEEIKTKVIKAGEDGKDPVLEKMKPILHKHQIPAQAFQELAGEFYSVVAEIAGSADKKPDGTPLADFEFKELGGADKAKPQIDAAETWLRGLEQSKKISEKLAGELKLMTGYSEGLAALTELRALVSNQPGIPKNLGGSAPDAITKEMLDSRVNDDRYQIHKDPHFIAETTRMFKEFYEA